MNDTTQSTVDLGELPCPDWCTDHLGERGQNSGPIDDEVPASTLLPIGRHCKVLYYYERFAGREPIAVHVDQVVSQTGLWEPEISFWPGIAGVENEHGEPPRTSRTFRVTEARALGEALIRAADIVSEIMPERCTNCGEPTARREVCLLCGMQQRSDEYQSARANLKAVDR